MKLEKIVVATDFSEGSDRAIDYALGLAEKAKAEVVVVNAFGITVLQLPDGAWIPQPEVIANLSNVAQQALDSTIAKARARYALVTGILREGDPREEIEAVAALVGADLIVIGTHGRRGVKRWLLGSVSEGVVRSSTIPVLVVPAKPTP